MNILKTLQIFKNQRQNVLTEEINRIDDKSSKDDKRLIRQKHMHMEREKIQQVKKQRLKATIQSNNTKNG